MAAKLYSQEIERSCIASMLNFSNKVIDFIPYITEDHFYFEPHKILFLTVKNLILGGSHVDTIIVSEKLAQIGIHRVDDIDIMDYIKILQRLDALNEESIGEYFQILQKYYHARQLTSTANKIREFVDKNISKGSQELMCGAEKIFGEKVNSYKTDSQPVDLAKDLIEELEAIGNEPKEIGIPCPYNELRKAYGNFTNGTLNIILAPTGQGKSSIMLDIARKCSKKNEVRSLYLDTEMSTKEQRIRLAASISGVNPWYLENGYWRKDGDMLRKVRDSWPKVKEMEESVDHLYVGDLDLSEVLSIVRRWYYRNIHDGMQCLIFYDYIKLNFSHEKPSESFKEYQIIGSKADKLKLLAQELQIPVIAGLQTNHENQASLSKQTMWYCDKMALLRAKTPEELEQYGPDFGSHILKLMKGRSQGQDAAGFKDLVKLPSGKYEKMFFNFDLNNFNVEERGSLLDILKVLENQVDHSEDQENKDDKPSRSGRTYNLNKTPF